MHRVTAYGVLAAALLLVSCRGNPEENVTEVANGPFKLMVRSREYHHSGILNVDVCVAEASTRKFPSEDWTQYFFHGYDFTGLSVEWAAKRSLDIDIRFSSGTVSYFRNYAIQRPTGPTPVDFHASIHEGLDAMKETRCVGQ
jgi:hypothetical protein